MLTKIIKRDGRVVDFDKGRITNAIMKAAQSVGISNTGMAERVTEKVLQYLERTLDNKLPDVETVQDVVERVLIEEGQAEIAKEYILYRAERARAREMNSQLMKMYEDLTFNYSKDSDLKRENANIDGDTAMGTMLRYGSEGAKRFNHLFILDKEASEAHLSGDIHIHDLDFYTQTLTCCQIPLDKLFEGGFSTGHGYLREPNDIRSYSALACIAIQSNQNDQHRYVSC